MTDHVLRHSPLGHFNAQLEQLAVYAGRAPAWIGKTHPADQISDFFGYRRSAVRKPALPSPVEAKALAVPSDNGFRFHDQEGRAPNLATSGKAIPRAYGLSHSVRTDGFGFCAVGLGSDDAGRESQLAGQHALGRNFGETTTTKTRRASSLRQVTRQNS